MFRFFQLPGLGGFHAFGVSEQAITIIAGPYIDPGIRNAKLERMLNGTVPVGKTNGEPGFCAADLENEEVWSAGVVRIVVLALKKARMLLRLLILPFLCAVRDQIGDVMHVVPVVLFRYVLPVHVSVIDTHGIEEDLSCALILSDSIKNVSGHMDHVSGIWRERSKPLGTRNCQLRMAALDGVNPVVVCGGVVGMLLQDLAQHRLSIKGTPTRLAVIGISVIQRQSVQKSRFQVVRIAVDQGLHMLGVCRLSFIVLLL